MNLDSAALSQMVDEVGNVTHHTETSAETPIKDALNRALAAVPRGDWQQLQRTDETGLRQFSDSDIATFEANDQFYPGPLQVDKVLSILPDTAGAAEVEIVTAKELHTRVQGLLDTPGIPRYAALVGQTIQHRRFDGALSCTVTCNVATNDNSKVLRVDYDKATGFVGGQSWEDVDGGFLAGVAMFRPVQGPYGLRRLSIPVGWAGAITFTINSVVVSLINTLEEPPTNTNLAHEVVTRPLYRLWPVPDADYGCIVTWARAPMRLTEDEDVPEIPVSPHLVLAAAADIFDSLDNNAVAAEKYERRAAASLIRIRQNYRGFQKVVARPYMGSFVDQTGSS